MDQILTAADVTVILEKAYKKSIQFTKYHLEPYSDSVIGFLGCHLRLVVEINSGQVLNFFVKCLPFDDQGRRNTLVGWQPFEGETSFYLDIAPKLQSDFKIDKWKPETYLVIRDETIVLEDLPISDGYKKLEIPLNLEQMQNAVTTVARFHASTILAEKRLGENFHNLFPLAFQEKLFILNNKDSWFKPGIDAITSIAEKLNFENYSTVPTILHKIFSILKPSKIHKNVICHGDLWANNFLFKDNGSILIDFQTIRYVPMVLDLLQMFYINVDREFRDQWEESLVRHYHSILLDTVKSNDSETPVPTIDEILKAYENFRLFGAIVAVTCLHISLIDPKIFGEMIGRSYEVRKKFVCEERRGIILPQLNENVNYRTKMKKLIEELFEVYEGFSEENI